MTDTQSSLCCPLCGSDEYLLSDKNQFLCAGCGTFLDDVSKADTSVANAKRFTRITPIMTSSLCH